MMLIENICYAGNWNDGQFPDEISKYLETNNIKELRTSVEQIEQNKDATMTSETVENFVKQLQGAKGSYWKILALQNYGYNIFIT